MSTKCFRSYRIKKTLLLNNNNLKYLLRQYKTKLSKHVGQTL